MSAELDRHKRVLYAGVGRNIEEHMSHSVMWRHGLDAVPCPSCMSDLFDRQYETRHERCWYENVDILPLPGEPGSPKKSNTCISMEDAISFLASAETVITSSYHGAYWASLLGREVVLVGHRGKFADPCWKQPWFNLETARERAFAAFKKIVEFAHAIA
jgi:exopolysaccharide biosynthesis predicted pyruvyltransferase EpsI